MSHPSSSKRRLEAKLFKLRAPDNDRKFICSASSFEELRQAARQCFRYKEPLLVTEDGFTLHDSAYDYIDTGASLIAEEDMSRLVTEHGSPRQASRSTQSVSQSAAERNEDLQSIKKEDTVSEERATFKVPPTGPPPPAFAQDFPIPTPVQEPLATGEATTNRAPHKPLPRVYTGTGKSRASPHGPRKGCPLCAGPHSFQNCPSSFCLLCGQYNHISSACDADEAVSTRNASGFAVFEGGQVCFDFQFNACHRGALACQNKHNCTICGAYAHHGAAHCHRRQLPPGEMHYPPLHFSSR